MGDITTGLIAHYKLDETNGTTATDSAGSNNGTVDGATWTTEGKINGALSFDGNNDYVSIPYGVITSTGTISAWIKTNGAGDWECFDQRNDSTNIFQFVNSYGSFYFGWYTAGVDYRVIISSGVFELTAGTWYHVVMTWDDTAKETLVYLDTELVGSNTTNLATYTPTVNGRLGGYSVTPFNGYIDDFRLYNRVLSSDDITDLYAYAGDIYTALPRRAIDGPFYGSLRGSVR